MKQENSYFYHGASSSHFPKSYSKDSIEKYLIMPQDWSDNKFIALEQAFNDARRSSSEMVILELMLEKALGKMVFKKIPNSHSYVHDGKIFLPPKNFKPAEIKTYHGDFLEKLFKEDDIYLIHYLKMLVPSDS